MSRLFCLQLELSCIDKILYETKLKGGWGGGFTAFNGWIVGKCIKCIYKVVLPHNFLAQLWRALKDSDFGVPTGATGGTGSF